MCLRRLVLHRENIDISIDDLGNTSLKLSKNKGPHQEGEKKIKFFDKDLLSNSSKDLEYSNCIHTFKDFMIQYVLLFNINGNIVYV